VLRHSISPEMQARKSALRRHRCQKGPVRFLCIVGYIFRTPGCPNIGFGHAFT
jgi:hypothetical protein